jgi:hypothetical protein
MEINARYPTERTVRSGSSAPTHLTRALLVCGVASGPFFYAVALAQILTRPGFDIRRDAISTLSLGELGWVQVANFAITGALALACASGMRSALRGGRGATWAPVLIATYGVALIVGAIFHPDPGLGFPPGAPAAMPASMSWHASIHMAAFAGAFACIVAACFVLRRRFASVGLTGWAWYCVATGAVTPVLVVAGSSIKSWVGVIFAIAGVVAFGWVSAVAARLRAGIDEGGK